jgi:hypothetical protein
MDQSIDLMVYHQGLTEELHRHPRYSEIVQHPLHLEMSSEVENVAAERVREWGRWDECQRWKFRIALEPEHRFGRSDLSSKVQFTSCPRQNAWILLRRERLELLSR